MTTDLPVTGQDVPVTPIIASKGKLTIKGVAKAEGSFVRFEEVEKPGGCATQSKFEVCNTTNYIPVEAILEAQGASLPLWANSLVLLLFLFIFRFLGYIVLRYFRHPK